MRKAAKKEDQMAVNVNADACIACGACVDACPTDALTVTDVAVCDDAACIDCGSCVGVCPTDALSL